MQSTKKRLLVIIIIFIATMIVAITALHFIKSNSDPSADVQVMTEKTEDEKPEEIEVIREEVREEPEDASEEEKVDVEFGELERLMRSIAEKTR